MEPAAAFASSVTPEPASYVAEHVAPQLMPPGLDVTVPVPAPALATVSVAERLNVAVTAWPALIVTVHGLATPVQAPDQPANVEPGSGVAVKVTTVPGG